MEAQLRAQPQEIVDEDGRDDEDASGTAVPGKAIATDQTAPESTSTSTLRFQMSSGAESRPVLSCLRPILASGLCTEFNHRAEPGRPFDPSGKVDILLLSVHYEQSGRFAEWSFFHSYFEPILQNMVSENRHNTTDKEKLPFWHFQLVRSNGSKLATLCEFRDQRYVEVPVGKASRIKKRDYAASDCGILIAIASPARSPQKHILSYGAIAGWASSSPDPAVETSELVAARQIVDHPVGSASSICLRCTWKSVFLVFTMDIYSRGLPEMICKPS